MPSFLDRVVFTASSGSTGSFIQGSSVTGYQLMAAAGAVGNATYRYGAQSTDLTQWEYGSGVWTSTNLTLTRAPIGNSLGSTALINFTNPPQVMVTLLAEDATQLYEPAGGNLNFFVAPSTASPAGNDLNPGSSLAPFLTIQRAVDVVASYDWQHQFVGKIFVADSASTYNLSAPIFVPPLRNPFLAGFYVIQGNTSTFSNVQITHTSGDVFIFNSPNVSWAVLGAQLNSNTGAALLAYGGTNVTGDDLIFNVGESALEAVGAGTIVQTSPFDQGKISFIRASARSFAAALLGGEVDVQNVQLTFLNSPNFTDAFFQCFDGIGTFANMTFVNSTTVTGPQYDFERDARFNGDVTTLPGSTVGNFADNSALYAPVLFAGSFYGFTQPSTVLLDNTVIPTGTWVLAKDSGKGSNSLMVNDGGKVVTIASQNLALQLHANLGGL